MIVQRPGGSRYTHTPPTDLQDLALPLSLIKQEETVAAERATRSGGSDAKSVLVLQLEDADIVSPFARQNLDPLQEGGCVFLRKNCRAARLAQPVDVLITQR